MGRKHTHTHTHTSSNVLLTTWHASVLNDHNNIISSSNIIPGTSFHRETVSYEEYFPINIWVGGSEEFLGKLNKSCTDFYGNKILYKNLEIFDKIFVPTFSRRRFRNALYGEKILLDGEMLCLGPVSTNLSKLFYAGGTQNLKGNG